MLTDSLTVDVILLVAAGLAGAMNALAGGGTLLTFPALLLTMSELQANATSTLALCPGSVAGAWGYRRELSAGRRWALLLLGPSLFGGVLGSFLAVWFPKYFAALVPWLVLTAGVLFTLQPWLTRVTGIGTVGHEPTWRMQAGVWGFQFLVGVYGGYFGAGIGILMLTALAFMGMGDIHQMNAVKTLLAAVINGLSVIVFIGYDQIVWRPALGMAVAAIIGGYLGARYGRQLPKLAIRWFVIATAAVVTVYCFAKSSG
jgi:hypothetical protein